MMIIMRYEIVRSLFATKAKDFITAVDERSIIVVKELKPQEGYDNLNKTARMIIDMLNTEAMTNVRVAYRDYKWMTLRKFHVHIKKLRWRLTSVIYFIVIRMLLHITILE